MYEIETIAAVHNVLGEGPLWSPREQALYWVDAEAARFFRLKPETGAMQTIELDQPAISCVALHQSGGLLLALTNGINYWDQQQFKLLVSREQLGLGATNRFNDGGVDRAGRFWIGTASDDPDNALYRINHDNTFEVMETERIISNGIAWSPDNRTMYYSDSGGTGIVYAYDFDLSSGTISNRRTFLPPTGTGAAADGLTVDSEGGVWIAYWDGWKVEHRDPTGKLIRQIDMPVQRPTSCNFGGPDLSVLYVTSATRELDRREHPQAGNVFAIQTDVKGLPEPEARLRIEDL